MIFNANLRARYLSELAVQIGDVESAVKRVFKYAQGTECI